MFKYILVFFLLGSSNLLYAQTTNSLFFQLKNIYQKNLYQSKNQKTPIFPVKNLILKKEKDFNIQLFQNIQNVVGYFKKQATKTISTPNLYDAMKSYIDNSSLLSASKKTPFKGCRLRLHKIKNKLCIDSKELYVLPYASEEEKHFLINRYFNTYILTADNSSFFSMDIYEKQATEKKQCVYQQKKWGESYMLPDESDRVASIDKKMFNLNQSKMIWFCSNSYSPFSDNKQICNLLKMQINKVQANGMSMHFLSSFVAKENSCQKSLQQEDVVTYSKKHQNIVNANSESSHYSIVAEKNNHLLVYTNSAYCSVSPDVKEVYKDNFSNIQSYTCIGEDKSSYYSNYRLLGINPEERSGKSSTELNSTIEDLEEYPED